jgi:general secretion pathway protein C
MPRSPASTHLTRFLFVATTALALALLGDARADADPPENEAETHATSAAPILARNPFDARTGRLTGLPICLGASVRRVVLSSDPAWSLAELVVDGRAVVAHAGADVGAWRVERVEGDLVRLRAANGAACVAVRASDGAALSEACRAAGFPLAPPCIVKTGPLAYDVASAMVDHVLEEQSELMRSARIVPELDADRRVVGVRLFGVRPGTSLSAIGLENGDVLRDVNGIDVCSPDKALEAYAKLRRADEIRLGLVRHGAPTTVVLRIR